MAGPSSLDEAFQREKKINDKWISSLFIHLIWVTLSTLMSIHKKNGDHPRNIFTRLKSTIHTYYPLYMKCTLKLIEH